MSFGPLQILLILVLVLVLFGAGKLPKVMGDLGKGAKSFKDGIQGKEDDTAKIENTKDDKKES